MTCQQSANDDECDKDEKSAISSFFIWIRPRQESQCLGRLWKYLFEIKIVKNRDKNRNTQCSPDSLEAEEEHPGYILIFSMVQQSIHVYLTPYNFFKGTHLNVEGEGSPSTFKFWHCDQVLATWDERGSLPRAGWPPGEGPCWWSSLSGLSSATSWLSSSSFSLTYCCRADYSDHFKRPVNPASCHGLIMMFLLLNLNIGANDVDNNKYNVGVVDVSSHSPTLPWPKKCDARSRCSDVDIDNIKVDIENIKEVDNR